MNQSHTILTVDAIVLRNSKVLLITRGRGAHKGKLAFPGGKVDYNEDPEVACFRELREETGIQATSLKLLTVKGQPGRDPRGHFVSIVYQVTVPEDAEPKANDDAAAADWYDIQTILQNGPDALAFDHYQILKETLQ